jgi:hypothetical protein
MTCATCSAIARTSGMSSPDTRNWTGKPTGGPFSRRDVRPRNAGKSASKTCSMRSRSRSRSALLVAVTTNCAKFDCCNCWSSGR